MVMRNTNGLLTNQYRDIISLVSLFIHFKNYRNMKEAKIISVAIAIAILLIVIGVLCPALLIILFLVVTYIMTR